MNLEQRTITSVEIAEMMGVNHFEILRKLEGNSKVIGILPTMTDNKIVVSDYFIPSTYQDASGKENRCYLVTKLGCDFLANKFTGEKGILFSAKYVKRFREMEETIQTGILDNLSTEMQALIMHDKKIQAVVEHIETHDKKIKTLENTMTIDYGQQRTLEKLVGNTVLTALGGKGRAYQKIGKKVFAECNRDIKDRFDVNSRCNIPKIKLNEACDYIKKWQPCTNTRILIEGYNNQINIE